MADLQAVIFDVDGTLVDSERDGHRVAFNEAFAAAGLPYHWDVEQYGPLLTTTGGQRRLTRFLVEQGYDDQEASALAETLQADKTRRFAAMVRSDLLPARPGAVELVEELRAEGVRTAVATTGSADWVHPLLDRLFGPDAFDFIFTRAQVPALKPDPAVYLAALAGLQVPADNAIAIEDSSVGMRAALAAGLRCLVVTNAYTRGQDFTGAAAVVSELRASGELVGSGLASQVDVALLRWLCRGERLAS